MFEEALIEMGIAYHQIRIAMPRHNGKVGPTPYDEMRFYKHMRMCCFENGRKQLVVYRINSTTT